MIIDMSCTTVSYHASKTLGQSLQKAHIDGIYTSPLIMRQRVLDFMPRGMRAHFLAGANHFERPPKRQSKRRQWWMPCMRTSSMLY
jgi:hypothetical protein